MRFRSALSALLLLPVIAGCAGGWRNGQPPAGYAPPDDRHWSEGAGDAAVWVANPDAAAPARASAAGATPRPAAPAAATATATAGGTQAVADGAVFRYRGAASSVHVAGEFNAWSTSADPMTKGEDGVWSLRKALAAGRHPYKFVVDGTNWKADDAATESMDDGFGGKNSVIVVGGTGAPAASPPAAAPPQSTPGAGTVAVADGAVFRYRGAAISVHVAGEFNAWSTSADPMAKGADGVWSLTKALAEGRHAYKFVVDGTNWKADEAAAESVDDGFGGKNSVVVVGGAATSPSPAAAPPRTDAAAVGAGRAPELLPEGVRFTFGGERVTSVHLAGDFNGWATSTDPLTRQSDGSWTLLRKLPRGTHAYKFLLDGKTWRLDVHNPSTADDGLGGRQSVIVVP